MTVALESLAPEHFALVAAWLSKPQVNEWLTSEWRGRKVDPTMVGIAVRNRRNRFYLVRSDGAPCGLVALADWDRDDRVAMIWYLLGDPPSGGSGVITQAVHELVRAAFDTLGIEALHAWVMEGNERSRRVLEKNGFREAGRLRLAAMHSGRRVDRVYLDLTRQDAGA